MTAKYTKIFPGKPKPHFGQDQLKKALGKVKLCEYSVSEKLFLIACLNDRSFLNLRKDEI